MQVNRCWWADETLAHVGYTQVVFFKSIVSVLNRNKLVNLLKVMRVYRYTELSYKITSLISRTCYLSSSGLTNTQTDAGVISNDSYRNITTNIPFKNFNNLFRLLLISLSLNIFYFSICTYTIT